MVVHGGDSTNDGEIGFDRKGMFDEILRDLLAPLHISAKGNPRAYTACLLAHLPRSHYISACTGKVPDMHRDDCLAEDRDSVEEPNDLINLPLYLSQPVCASHEAVEIRAGSWSASGWDGSCRGRSDARTFLVYLSQSNSYITPTRRFVDAEEWTGRGGGGHT